MESQPAARGPRPAPGAEKAGGRSRLRAWACALLAALLLVPAPAQAESWEEAALRLEREARQEKVDAASRDLFLAISTSDSSKAALAIALGADVNQCVAHRGGSRKVCVSRMLDYALEVYAPDRAEDGGQRGLSVLRLLLSKGAMLVEDDLSRGRRNSLALQKLFSKEAALRLFLESGYAVTPDILAVAMQYRSPSEPRRSSFPLQILLLNSSYSESSTFSTTDFGREVADGVIRHVRGLDALGGPSWPPGVVTDITLLHLAAVTGNTELASYLIRQGADMNARTSGGVTPLEQAYALWIYTWDDEAWERDFRFESATFLDFMRLLLMHGTDADEILADFRARREVYERVFTGYCRESPLPDPARPGETTSLDDFLGRSFADCEWTLSSYEVLDPRAQNLCTIVVTFEGVLLSDGSRMRIPMVFADNMLYIAGSQLKDLQYPVTRNGRRLKPEETLKFWRSLGLKVSYEEGN